MYLSVYNARCIAKNVDSCKFAMQRLLNFAPPERVFAVGGWAYHTMAKPNKTVDLAIQMPSSCFDEKDQLDGRYAARRAQYLCEVAAALRRKAAFKRLSWEFLQHDARQAAPCRRTPSAAGLAACAMALVTSARWRCMAWCFAGQ